MINLVLVLTLKIRQVGECFIIENAAGRVLAYIYFGDQESRRVAVRRMNKADALRIAQITARALTAEAS